MDTRQSLTPTSRFCNFTAESAPVSLGPTRRLKPFGLSISKRLRPTLSLLPPVKFIAGDCIDVPVSFSKITLEHIKFVLATGIAPKEYVNP